MAHSTSGSSALTECKEALASTKLASTWILLSHYCPRDVLTKKAASHFAGAVATVFKKFLGWRNATLRARKNPA